MKRTKCGMDACVCHRDGSGETPKLLFTIETFKRNFLYLFSPGVKHIHLDHIN